MEEARRADDSEQQSQASEPGERSERSDSGASTASEEPLSEAKGRARETAAAPPSDLPRGRSSPRQICGSPLRGLERNRTGRGRVAAISVLAIRSPSREVELQADLWKPMKAETKSSWAREGVRKFSFWACENFCFKAWLPIWQQAHRAHRLTTKSNAKCFLKTEARQQRMRR